MKFLRAMFGSTEAEAIRMVSEPSSARDRLDQALARRPAAQEALATATAAIERGRATISEASTAARRAGNADRDAAEAAKQIALSTSHDAPSDAPAIQAAVEARRASDIARFRAEGAAAALPELKSREADARAALAGVEQEIRSAVVATLTAELAENWTQLEQASATFQAAQLQVAALREITRSWGPAHQWCTTSSATSSAEIQRRLDELAPRPPDPATLRASERERSPCVPYCPSTGRGLRWPQHGHGHPCLSWRGCT